MNLKFGIIEDRESQAKDLEIHIMAWAGVTNNSCSVIHVKSESEFIAKLSDFMNCDVLFFDIQLTENNDATGLELAKKIRDEGYANYIVFVTNLADFALRGYTARAYDFLVKPVHSLQLSELLNDILKSMDIPLIFKFSIKKKEIQVELANICYFSANLHKVDIYMISDKLNRKESITTGNRKFLLPDYSYVISFKKLLQEINGIPILVQANRSTILNINNIQSITGSQVYMKNGAEIRITEQYLWKVRQVFFKSSRFIRR